MAFAWVASGGASLEYLEGKALPGVDVLNRAAGQELDSRYHPGSGPGLRSVLSPGRVSVSTARTISGRACRASAIPLRRAATSDSGAFPTRSTAATR